MQRYGANHTVAKAGWLKRIASFLCHNHHWSEGLIAQGQQLVTTSRWVQHQVISTIVPIIPQSELPRNNKERKNHPFRTAKL